MADTIYGLAHQGEIRYVGKTRYPETRLQSHLKGARTGRAHRDHWIRSVNYDVQLVILERDPPGPDGLNMAEKAWIYTLRHLYGCRLTNLTDGGDGQSPGYQPSNAARKNMSLAGRQRYADSVKGPLGREASARGGRLLRDRPKSAEHRANIAKAITGKRYGPINEEKRAKLSAAAKARGFTHKTDCLCRFCENHRPMVARGGGACA
jgi:hypothetical protein